MEDINDLSDEIQLNKQRLAKTAENTVNIFKKMMEINDKSEENKNENDLLNQSFQNLASNVETFDKRIGDIEKNDDDLTASLDQFKIEFEADLGELDSDTKLKIQNQRSEQEVLINDLSKQMDDFIKSFNESLVAEQNASSELERKLVEISCRVENLEINGIIADSTSTETGIIDDSLEEEPTSPEPIPEQSTTDLYEEYQDQSEDLLHFLSGEPTELRTADNFCLTFSDTKSMKAYNPIIEKHATYHLATWEPCNNQPNQWFRAVDNTLQGYIPSYTGIGAEDYLTSLDSSTKCLTPLPISQNLHANLDNCDLWQFLEGAGTYLFAVDCYHTDQSNTEPVNYQKFRFDSDLSIMHSECEHQLNLGSMGNENSGYRAFLTSSVVTDTFSSAKVIFLDFEDHLSNNDADVVGNDDYDLTPFTPDPPAPENDHNIPEELQEPNLMSFLNGNPSQIKGLINGKTFCLSAQNSYSMAVYNPSEGFSNFTVENELLWNECLQVDLENLESLSASELLSFSNQLYIYDYESNQIRSYIDETQCVTPLPISNAFHKNLGSCDVWNLLPKAGTYLFMTECGANPDPLAQQFQYNYQNNHLESKCAHNLPLGKNGYYDNNSETQVIRAFLSDNEFTFSTGASVAIDFTMISGSNESGEGEKVEEESDGADQSEAQPEAEAEPESRVFSQNRLIIDDSNVQPEGEQYHLYLSDLVYGHN